MSRITNILAGIVVAAVLIGAGAYAYVTRPTKSPSETPPPAASNSANLQGNERLFEVSSQDSEATYSLNEVLRGDPVTVVGKTNAVQGSIILDRARLTDARVSTIRVNVRTLKTDNDRRDNTVRRMVLKSEQDEYEYIEFKPKMLSKLPTNIENRATFPIQVTGDLIVAGATKEVTFEGEAYFESDSRLVADMKSKVHYEDLNIHVPDLPFLANVEKDVTLALHLVADQKTN